MAGVKSSKAFAATARSSPDVSSDMGLSVAKDTGVANIVVRINGCPMLLVARRASGGWRNPFGPNDWDAEKSGMVTGMGMSLKIELVKRSGGPVGIENPASS